MRVDPPSGGIASIFLHACRLDADQACHLRSFELFVDHGTIVGVDLGLHPWKHAFGHNEFSLFEDFTVRTTSARSGKLGIAFGDHGACGTQDTF